MNPLGRILVADDEQTFLESTADLLRREGYECDTASDATSAAESLASRAYDLLITDLKMPGNSDLELVRDVPQLSEGLPVILVTGYPSIRSAIESVQLRVMAYFVKPVDFEELLKGVQTSVKYSQICRALRDTHSHLSQWCRDLENVQSGLWTARGDDWTVPVSRFVALTIRNIGTSLCDLQHLMEVFTCPREEPAVCHLLGCPQRSAMLSALRETVSVLESTKGSFKSRDLGDLRRKLVEIIDKT